MKKFPPRQTALLLKDHFLKQQGYVGFLARAVVPAWLAMRVALAAFMTRVHPTRLSINKIWASICTWIRIQKIIHWMSVAEKKILLRWVQDKVRLRSVTNFGADWCDGIVLCALMDALVPGTFPRYDLLNPEESFVNLKRGLRVAKTQLGVVGLVKLEDFYGDHENLAKNLARFLAIIRLKYELQPLLPSIVTDDMTGNRKSLVEEIDTEEVLQDASCLVRGMGLQLAVKGRMSRFNIYLKTNTCLDIVVEIKGPDGDYFTERITSRSPRRKNLLTHETRYRSKASKGELTSGKLVNMPFEYEIGHGKVSVGYMPLHSGRHKLTIICRGKHVIGSPFTVSVDESIDVPDQVRRPLRRLLPKGSSFDDAGNFSLPVTMREVMPDSGTKLRPNEKLACLGAENNMKVPVVTGRKVLRVIRRVVVRHGVEVPWDGVSPLMRDPYAWSSTSGILCEEFNEDHASDVVICEASSKISQVASDSKTLNVSDRGQPSYETEVVSAFDAEAVSIGIMSVSKTDDETKDTEETVLEEENFAAGVRNESAVNANEILHSTPMQDHASLSHPRVPNELPFGSKFYCPEVDTIPETSETACSDCHRLECEDTAASIDSSEAVQDEDKEKEYGSPETALANCDEFPAVKHIEFGPILQNEDIVEDVFFQTCSFQIYTDDITLTDSSHNLIELNTPRSSFRKNKGSHISRSTIAAATDSNTTRILNANENPSENLSSEIEENQEDCCQETILLQEQPSKECESESEAGIQNYTTGLDDIETSHSSEMLPTITINGMVEPEIGKGEPGGTEKENIADAECVEEDIDVGFCHDQGTCLEEINDDKKSVQEDPSNYTVTILKRNFEMADKNGERSSSLECQTPKLPRPFETRVQKNGNGHKISPAASVRKLPTFLRYRNSPVPRGYDAKSIVVSSVREKVNRWETVSKNPAN